MAFRRTTAINKLLAMTARKRVVQGGTSAGKTYGIIPCLIDYAAKNPRKKITVVAESIPAVKDGAVTIFQNVMQDTGRWFPDRWLGNPMQYTFANGSIIQFKSFDNIGKAKAAGKRDVLFLNEANHINFEIADALMVRTTEIIWIDFNPDNEFWAHTETLTEPNSEFLSLNYKDNEACPPEIIQELLIKQKKAETSEYWKNWCRVYIDGELGCFEGLIFPEIVLIDEMPADGYKWRVKGIDFGYNPDPSTVVDVGLIDNNIYIDELLYKTGLTGSDLASEIEKLKIKKGYDEIFADGARPEIIEEIRRKGYNIKAAKKGDGSVNFGIDLMQRLKIHITKRSLNTVKEFRSYLWIKDSNGNVTGKPIDAFNHSIDPIRYCVSMKLDKQKVFGISMR